jgi:hypothetical protein
VLTFTLRGSSAPIDEPPSQSGLIAPLSFADRETSFDKLSATQYAVAGD